MQSFLVALAFLTIIPIRFREMPTETAIARSRFWYPVVGLLLGSLLGGWAYLLSLCIPPMLAAFLVLVLWVILTGALHLDGFGDLCDGLFGGKTPEDRLRIMKDPRRGTFGVVGTVLLLLGKFVACVELLNRWGPSAALAAGLAATLARFLVLTVAAGARYPRSEGTGRLIVEATQNLEAIAFSLLAIAAVGWWPWVVLQPVWSAPRGPEGRYYHLFPNAEAVLLVILLIVPAWSGVVLVRKCCESRLGGITGDCLGAAIELAELVFLISAVIGLTVISY